MNFEPFLNEMASLGKGTPQTIRAYRHDLKLFGDFAAGRSIAEPSQIDRTLIVAYEAWMRDKQNARTGKTGLADTSIARRLSAVSSFLEYCRNHDPDLRNPLKGKRRKWQKNSKPNPVNEWDLDMLLANITSDRDRVLFTLFAATGLRVSEMQPLNRDSIRIEVERQPDGKVRARGCGEVVGKGGKRRNFYVDHDTLRAYAAYIKSRTDSQPALFISERHQRMSIRAMQERLGHWCRQIGFRHINVHRLRHTYATRLANQNISSMILKDLMGHSSFSTTQKYFKLSDETLARGYFSAMEQISRS